jgi:hypothetical protein
VGPLSRRITVQSTSVRREDLYTSISRLCPRIRGRVITLSANTGSVPADGVTTVTLVANVSPSLPSGRHSVAFRTTVWQFLPGRTGEFTIEADGSNRAQATLVSRRQERGG